MQRPQRLRAYFDSADALEWLTVQAHSSGRPDLSSLLELQLLYVEADVVLGAMALEGMLRQASALRLM